MLRDILFIIAIIIIWEILTTTLSWKFIMKRPLRQLPAGLRTTYRMRRG